MDNVRILDAGQCQKRGGIDPYTSAAFGGGNDTVTGVGELEFSGTSRRTYAVMGTAFVESNSGAAYAARTGSLTITAGNDNIWDFAHCYVGGGGVLLGGNGVSGDSLLKWTTAGSNAAVLAVSSRFTTAKFWEWWDGRAWVGYTNNAPNQGWHSNDFDVDTWDEQNDLNIGAECTGIRHMGTDKDKGVNAYHAHSGVWIIRPTELGDAPYSIDQAADKGTISNKSIINVPSGDGVAYQAYARKDGFYKFVLGQGSFKFSGNLDGTRFWDDVNQDRMHMCHGILYEDKNEIWWWIPVGTSQTNVNKIIVYNYKLNIWMGPFTGANCIRNCSTIIDALPHAGGFGDGMVYLHEDATIEDDDGTTQVAIQGSFDTGSKAPAGPQHNCQWHYTDVRFDVEEDTTCEMLQMSPDFASRTESITLGSDFDALVTEFIIGTSIIKGNALVRQDQVDLKGYSPFCQLKFRNINVQETFSIRGASMAYTAFPQARRPQSAA